MIRNCILNFIGFVENCSQHGLVNGNSILSNILERIAIINECLIERNNEDFTYLDFNKLFYTISHYRLLVKMKLVKTC